MSTKRIGFVFVLLLVVIWLCIAVLMFMVARDPTCGGAEQLVLFGQCVTVSVGLLIFTTGFVPILFFIALLIDASKKPKVPKS